MREDDSRDGAEVSLAMLAEDVGGDDPAVVLADVGQRPDSGHVTNRPDSIARIHPGIDWDAMRCRLDADGLETNVADAGAATRGHEQLLGGQLLAILEAHEITTGRSGGDRRRAAPEMDAQTVRADRLAERLTELAGLAGKDVVHALDEIDSGAEGRERLGQFDSDRPAAEDDQRLWDLPRARGLAVGPYAVELAQAGNRWDHRLRAGGEHDVAGRVGAPVDLDGSGTGDPPVAADQLDAGRGQPLDLTGVVVVGDHVVAPLNRRCAVGVAGHGLGGAGGGQRAGQRFARPQQRPSGNAGVIRAFT